MINYEWKQYSQYMWLFSAFNAPGFLVPCSEGNLSKKVELNTESW